MNEDSHMYLSLKMLEAEDNNNNNTMWENKKKALDKLDFLFHKEAVDKRPVTSLITHWFTIQINDRQVS